MRSHRLVGLLVIQLVLPGVAGADPGFPQVTGAEPAWEDGFGEDLQPFEDASAVEIRYVDSEAGLDSYDGSEAYPFATISKALEVISAITTEGGTVVVGAGIYHEQVRPPDISASRANPVTLLADPPDGRSVVLDGEGVVPDSEGNLDAPAGVSLYRESVFIIRGFLIRNWSGYGLAIQQSSDCQVLDCAFQDNGTAMNDPVDVVLISSLDARVIGNLFDSATERALDDRSTDSWIALNTFSGHTSSAVKIGPYPGGRGCLLAHNLFFDNPAAQGVVYAGDVRGVTVQRNLLVRGNLQGIRIDGAEDSVFSLNTAVGFHAGIQLRDLFGCRVEGNILADNTMGVEFLSLYLQDTTVDYNLYHGNTADVEQGDAGPNAVFADPGFSDPGQDDYTLAAGGAAVDAGPPDLPVPEGGGERVDAGAFERGAGDPFWHYQPVGSVADLTPAFTWVYVDRDPAAVQDAFRVQLDTHHGFDSPELLDSGWVTGGATTWTVPHRYELAAGRWYVRVETRDARGQAGPFSDPHLAFEVSQAPACAAQSGTPCAPLDGCDGSWLPASDEPRCCLGDCTACPDADSDGHLDAACGGLDCDDGDAAVNPDAYETCDNGIDDDCDGATDLGDADCGCVDHDQDGYGDNCAAGPDCDDSIASVHPGADEECNYVDDDCDGDTDEGFDLDIDPDNCGECFWACRAAEVCDLGTCADSCGSGRTDCDRACIDTSTDLGNCGACGQTCDLPNAGERCADGQCLLTACEPGWVDGNGDQSDGCEYECTPSPEGAEICDNGIDDNCDGQIDEACEGTGGGCSCGAQTGPRTWVTFLFVVLCLRAVARRSGLWPAKAGCRRRRR